MSTLIAGHWLPSTRRDPRAIGLYFRHYSSEKGGRKASCYTAGFTGQGQCSVYLTERCDALFAWVLQTVPRMDGQEGVYCSIFRNEGPALSSELIKEADGLAWDRWPHEDRHFTFVDPTKVESANPGYCFLMAGWRRLAKRTSRGLFIFEVVR